MGENLLYDSHKVPSLPTNLPIRTIHFDLYNTSPIDTPKILLYSCCLRMQHFLEILLVSQQYNIFTPRSMTKCIHIHSIFIENMNGVAHQISGQKVDFLASVCFYLMIHIYSFIYDCRYLKQRCQA